MPIQQKLTPPVFPFSNFAGWDMIKICLLPIIKKQYQLVFFSKIKSLKVCHFKLSLKRNALVAVSLMVMVRNHSSGGQFLTVVFITRTIPAEA